MNTIALTGYQPSRTMSKWFYQTVFMVESKDIAPSRDLRHIHHARPHSACTQELERVYFSSFDQLVRSARLLVDDISTASDVVQEAFVKALVAQPTFSNSDALAYMKTAVMNQARTTLRKRGVSRKHLSSIPVEESNAAHKEVDELPVDASVIQLALSQLSRRQRECVMLFHTYSMSHKEIGHELGISEGSVKQHLSRGLRNLNDALEGAK